VTEKQKDIKNGTLLVIIVKIDRNQFLKV